MIYGIGTDILQISRLAAVMDRQGERFALRVLGAEEMAQYHRRGARLPQRGLRYLATRFAAKEALSKALGLGMRTPMQWRLAQTLNGPSGKPEIVASGILLDHMRAHGLRAHVTITDEVDYAVAFVIVEQDVPAIRT
ncbi:MAG TPA: holo-ACP synthase [Burkholderiaceae bacterium]